MALGLSLITTWTTAQPGGPGPGPGGPGPRPAAASAGAGAGPAGGHWGARYTPGWSLMTQAERNEHRERMRSMKTHQECEAYHQQHREKMAERAKERGVAAPRALPRDPCRGLP